MQRLRVFDNNSRQNRWQEFSVETVNNAAECLANFEEPSYRKCFVKNFPELPEQVFNTQVMCAYAFLATQRAKIAVELNQTQKKPPGQFRVMNTLAGEIIMEKGDVAWAHVKYAVLSHVQEIIATIHDDARILEFHLVQDNHDASEYTFANYTVSEKSTDAEILGQPNHSPQPCVSYFISVLSPVDGPEVEGFAHTPHPHYLDYVDYKHEKSNNYLAVIYADLRPDTLVGDCYLAEQYYKACRAADNAHDFMINAGRLSHLLASLHWANGNEIIAEWLIASIAKEKGIVLGPFSFRDKITWNWKALVTPNREAYAEWYAKNAYLFVVEPLHVKQCGTNWMQRNCCVM